MKAYDYFSEEVSAKTDDLVRARFPLEIVGEQVAMDLWVLGGEDRQIFTVRSPANRGARHNYSERYWDRLMHTLVVRQSGEAWERPFVAVYEPFIQEDGSKIKTVKALAPNTWIVSGDCWTRTLKLDGVELSISKD